MTKPESKAPAFQFYPADYLADENVQVMTLEEEGAYNRAMAYCWREGTIPADIGRLQRLIGKNCSEATAEAVKSCFEPHPNHPSRMVHMRLEEEREKQADWAAKSSAGGKKSAEVRRQKAKERLKSQSSELKGGSTLVPTISQPNPNSSSTSSSTISLSNERDSTPKKTRVFPPPGDEVRPMVFLTKEQQETLRKSVTPKEANYWLTEMAMSAENKPKQWKEYRNHLTTLRQWRRRKIADGYQWNEAKGIYERKNPFAKPEPSRPRPTYTPPAQREDKPRNEAETAAARKLLHEKFPQLAAKTSGNDAMKGTEQSAPTTMTTEKKNE